jgi:hypothetical protein
MANQGWSSTYHNWPNSDHASWHPSNGKGTDNSTRKGKGSDSNNSQSNFHNAARRSTSKIECHHCHRLNDKSTSTCWYCNKNIAHSTKAGKGGTSKGGRGKGLSALPPADPQIQRVIDEIPPATLREIKAHSLWKEWGFTPPDPILRNRLLDNIDSAIRIHAGVILAAQNSPGSDCAQETIRIAVLKGIKLDKKTPPQQILELTRAETTIRTEIAATRRQIAELQRRLQRKELHAETIGSEVGPHPTACRRHRNRPRHRCRSCH